MLRSCTVGAGAWHTSRYRSIVASFAEPTTSACFGEYFIMDPYTNTVYPFNEVFAHLVIIEDEDFNEVFAYFECIDAPNADTHSTDVK